MRPAAHLLSFASPKERRQRKGDPQSASRIRPVGRTGAACDARAWGGADELAAFFELRSNSIGKLEHEVRVSCGTRTHPRPCASRRSQQGWGAGTARLLPSQLRLASATRCALPTCWARALWLAERSEGPQAERSNGPSGARSHPLLTVPRSAGPGVSACRRTRASLSDSPRLFERSSPAGGTQRVPRCTPGLSIAGCPLAAGEGDTGSGVAFLLGTFLWRSKEQVPRPPGRDPVSASRSSKQSPPAPRGTDPTAWKSSTNY